ncbi:hypothetical protein Zm00014a_011742 [Zea mays]|uniref:Uncharacterized protein n=1 Tax=Zea mays TaxID=4577 RepID=A0A3L6DLB6_MAIZE|nr:hypothetical protein Zm00014a_011742 [Zea mays]
MASSSAAFAILLFFFAVAVQSARGGHQLACEELPPDACAFAVSSGGRRCVLERTPEGAHRCQTSAVVGMQMQGGWVETRDRRVRARLHAGSTAPRWASPSPAPRPRTAAPSARSARRRAGTGAPTSSTSTPPLPRLKVRVSLPALCEAEKKAGNRRMMTGKAPLGAPVAAPEAAPAPCEE